MNKLQQSNPLLDTITSGPGNRRTVAVSWTVPEAVLDLLTQVSVAYPGKSLSTIASAAIQDSLQRAVANGEINISDAAGITWASLNAAKAKRSHSRVQAKRSLAVRRKGVSRG